jgi:hypothetical protein
MASMSSALLSVLRVCNRRIFKHREIQRHVMFILIGPHVRYFSNGNQTGCPTLKKRNHGLPNPTNSKIPSFYFFFFS